jgi:hypothetical protein
MERRLVGSTLATIPHVVPRTQLRTLDVRRTLALIDELIGDADEMVQKALAWALRGWARVDREAVGAWLDARSRLAATDGDGHSAWVIRDALAPQPAPLADAIRARLAGTRRRPGAPSTSRASVAARRFGLEALVGGAVAQQGERYAGSGR